MCHPSACPGRTKRRPVAASCGVIALLIASPAALADDPNVLTDPFQVTLGTFAMSSDTEVRLDGDTEQGTPVDWERTFGADDANRFRLDGYWRFADRHKVRFLWFNYSRSDSRTAEREIDWGGETVPVSATLDGEFSFDVYELSYEYAFLRRETYEVSASIGLHYTDLSLRLAASVDAPDNSLDRVVDEEATLAAPLPVFGLRGTWQLPHRFSIEASAQYFAVSIDEYDGSLQDLRIGVTWQPRWWVGVGVGYDQFSIDVDVDKTKFKGALDWTYSGPMVYYSLVF
jgi:hypothetical protein